MPQPVKGATDPFRASGSPGQSTPTRSRYVPNIARTPDAPSRMISLFLCERLRDVRISKLGEFRSHCTLTVANIHTASLVAGLTCRRYFRPLLVLQMSQLKEWLLFLKGEVQRAAIHARTRFALCHQRRALKRFLSCYDGLFLGTL